MNINQLIFRNLKKNLSHYSLYVFALIFSVALYFAFVTLQFDPSMDEAKGSIKGAAAMKSASILLVAIVAIFLLYANNIFIKRRSREIGLFQLIGMTRDKIFRLLSAENLLLYIGSLLAGIALGFSVSKLILMILFKVIGVDELAALHFSGKALVQTLIVFGAIYVLIMLMNYSFIKRQSILNLFRATSVTETRVKKISAAEIVIGLLGILLISVGYYVSSKLFGGDFATMNSLFGAMILILASVIIGTYLFYKGSVRFITNLIRKSKNGYLNVNQVLSLSSIMFRMKSNALLLTIITTVSALAIGLLSLSYISYYSAEKSAEQSVPDHFGFSTVQDADRFTEMLKSKDIAYSEKKLEVIQAAFDATQILDTSLDTLKIDPKAMVMPVISEQSAGLDVQKDEVILSGYDDLMQSFMALKSSGNIVLKDLKNSFPLNYTDMHAKHYIDYYYTSGGLPVAIVDDSVFQSLKQNADPKIQKKTSIYIGVNINKKSQIEEANSLFLSKTFGELSHSQLDMSTTQKRNMGMIMFIVAFLGLTFLITSGCILYFKQMGESEEEKGSYTILRKLGFTQGDLLRGLQAKQLFSFGIPLAVGLLHSYFAVRSGWFLFGTELWTPMFIVMIMYTVLYSIFGLLSVLYCKKVIRQAL
ncbi:bacitracin ABC transporter permease [Paenibacillus stellifer]|uniref:Bacitracin ABC transporter permease n=1 Tax=Paenibacillus stellifer TaxID=169760 RepID=A0A089LR21_9BACL|nr:ABC transporter permease [Paenibacillus stellifer]AIQ63976.1 bacitracin ABC transporter permease [Paenibacillus stellifer]